MGYSHFDFGKVIRHLQNAGITSLIWNGDVLKWSPPNKELHIDVLTSIRYSDPKHFVLTLEVIK